MRAFAITWVLSLALMALPYGGAMAQGGAPAPAQCEKIVASGPPEYAPLSFLKDGQIVGAAPDLAKRVAGEIGVPIEIRHVGSWRRALRLHEVGEVDLLVSLYKTPEREPLMAFAGPFWQEDTVLVMHRDRPVQYERWEDLIPLTGGTIGGDSRGSAFDEFLRTRLTMFFTPHQANLVAMLRAGRVDYLVLGRNSMFTEEFERTGGDFVIHPTPVDSHDVYMSISKASPCLIHLARVSAALKDLAADGTAKRLYMDWDSR